MSYTNIIFTSKEHLHMLHTLEKETLELEKLIQEGASVSTEEFRVALNTFRRVESINSDNASTYLQIKRFARKLYWGSQRNLSPSDSEIKRYFQNWSMPPKEYHYNEIRKALELYDLSQDLLRI